VDVAILGASGDCGREIAAQLVASRLLAPTERMQLVGRAEGRSGKALYGLVADLADAHAEYVPDMDVALRPRDVVADLWVVSCGATAPTDAGLVDRGSLAEGNARIFAEYANALAEHGTGSEIVVVVSNPVELGVALFAQAIGRDRVIGIGAYQDSLRFRREIAADLGVRRQRVGGFMLGEHGDAQLPVWSSVTVHGMNDADLWNTITTLRRGTDDLPFINFCREERAKLTDLVYGGEIAEAYRRLESLPPDVRVVLKPFITHLSGSKTVMATANVTVDLVQTLLDGRDVLIAGQVVLDKYDFYGLTGPLGVPVIVGQSGVKRVVEIPLTGTERQQMRNISEQVTGKVNAWMGGLK
jgi:malate dehydrogenase